ncbi:MAG: hypothetical protein MRY72_09565, partial [Aquisalinus sp.]|nr:hypothetical protein [Aquisalinus sp.]
NRMFVIVEQEFPEEYAEFIRDLSKSKRDETAFDLGRQFIMHLRKTHAKHLKSTTSTKLIEVIEADQLLIGAIRERAGAELCSAYLLTGPSALPQGLTPFVSEAERSVETLFLAISDGRHINNPRSTPSESDWTKFLEYWQSEGATEPMIEAMLNPETSGADFCGTYLSFLTMLISYDSTQADAIRADHLFQKAILN